ncbi:uncharacterized protein LOC125234156 isoform X2 [Leguminivora glycinivorella]|uniref:uncharacterized protein LOC125234156 isoform X2 n=1 Tax=Leguminivora glycinivorella TaxID=1035111 RepID=UPI00200CB62E|nr:uncharacterized protein LOC125234156 isoform X2 [Leguminivora glycinivorella]
MTEAILKENIKRRGTCKAQLTNFNTYLSELPEKLTPHQRFELELRISRLELVFNDFHDVQLQIECAHEEAAEQYSQRNTFEATYYSSIARAQLLLSEAEGPAGRSSKSPPADMQVTDMKRTKLGPK